MAKKAVGRTKGEKVISSLQFVTAYRDAKSLIELKKALKGLTDKEWGNDKIDAKIAQMRVKGVMMKSLFQRGWAEPKENQRISASDLNLLLADSDVLLSPEQMPKKRAKP
jgi:hypothetical protein